MALRWANDLGRALQASIIGFAAGGTFASLEMWDGYYLILVIAASARVIVAKELAKAPVVGGTVAKRSNRTAMSVARPAII